MSLWTGRRFLDVILKLIIRCVKVKCVNKLEEKSVLMRRVKGLHSAFVDLHHGMSKILAEHMCDGNCGNLLLDSVDNVGLLLAFDVCDNVITMRYQRSPLCTQWCSGTSGIMGVLWPWRAREREPITGVLGQNAQRGPWAEPLVRGSGGEAPWTWKCF